ncbi:MAG: hypothetical protein AAB431_02810 [Patescibacteria group bacterium]
MSFAPEAHSITKIQWQILVDIDRMACALDSDSVPAAIAVYVARRHKGTNPEGTILALVREGYLLKKKDERYEVGGKRLPQRSSGLPGNETTPLDQKTIETIATQWKAGGRDIDAFFAVEVAPSNGDARKGRKKKE